MGLRFRKRLNIFSFLGKGPSRGSFFLYRSFVVSGIETSGSSLTLAYDGSLIRAASGSRLYRSFVVLGIETSGFSLTLAYDGSLIRAASGSRLYRSFVVSGVETFGFSLTTPTGGHAHVSAEAPSGQRSPTRPIDIGRLGLSVRPLVLRSGIKLLRYALAFAYDGSLIRAASGSR